MEYLPFGGLAPRDITTLIYDPFNETSPIGLRKDLKDGDVSDASLMFQFFKQFLQDLKESQPLKLTQKGNLNRKFVHQLYDHRIITSDYIDSGRIKLLKEDDFYPIHFSHFIAKMAGLARKYRNKLSLTKKGEKLLNSDALLYLELLKTYTTKYNWAYMTYDPENVVQLGWAYSLFNFIRYGREERKVDFYVGKYLEIFHEMLHEFPANVHLSQEYRMFSCFNNRFFGRFCDLFGFAETRREGEDFKDRQYLAKKTPLLDKVFYVKTNLGNFGMN